MMPEHWIASTVAECCEILDSKRIPLNSAERANMKGDIPYYGANGVVDHIDQYIFDEPLILLAEDGGYFDEAATRPICQRVDGKSWVNNHAHVLRAKSAVRDWVYYWFVHRDITAYINSGTRSKLNQADLRQLPIMLPPLAEQKKIAEILGSVDDAIAATKAVIEQTKQVKKGLLQELLTKGIGHTKFKQTEIGDIPVSWTVCRLDEIARVERGRFSHRPRNAPHLYGGMYPFLQTGDIAAAERIVTYHQTLNDEGLATSRLFPAGTILVSIVGANVGEAAITTFAAACPDSVIAITPTLVDREWLFQTASTWKPNLQNKATQSARQNINLETLRPMFIGVPPIDEQRKIADLAVTISESVAAAQSLLHQQQVLKSGLLEELLTGKLRVAV